MNDYPVDFADVNIKFPSKSLAGVPTAIVGGAFAVYPSNSVTQVTTGLTFTGSFDGVTGLNNIKIDLSADAAYVAGKDYSVVATAGTVDGVSIVGEVVDRFTIGLSAAYDRLGTPAGASVSADVAAVKVDTAAVLVDTGTSGVIVATNNDKAGYSISGTKTTLDALNDIAATAIVSAGAITTLAGAVVNVDLVDVTTTNTDMRGTDSALPAASYTAPDNAGISSNGSAIASLNNITAAEVWAAATRTLTAGTNIALAKGVGVTGFNDIAATEIVSGGAITTLAGSVVNVDLVDVTTTNTDMRGTDGANTTTPPTSAAIAGAVWDEALTGDTHNIATSAGRRLRNITSEVIRAETAQGPGTGTNQIQLDAGASATSGSYDPSRISIVLGTGLGQSRMVLDYNGATKTATVDRDWRVLPDATSEYVILSDAGREHVNEGLATAGTSTTIQLNSTASTYDDAYIGQTIFLRSGSGADQARLVIDYVGATRTATVSNSWDVTPTADSAYVMLPTAITDNVTLVNQMLTTQMTESYAADGVAPTLAEAAFLTLQNLQDFEFSGTTQTVKKLDGSTTAATYTLDDAASPTSKTRAT